MFGDAELSPFLKKRRMFGQLNGSVRKNSRDTDINPMNGFFGFQSVFCLVPLSTLPTVFRKNKKTFFDLPKLENKKKDMSEDFGLNIGFSFDI